MQIIHHWSTDSIGYGSILSHHTSIGNVNGSPKLHFEPPQLLNFDFNEDLDSAFDFHADPASRMIGINAHPDQQPVLRIRNPVLFDSWIRD
jgi:hypothetical protein